MVRIITASYTTYIDFKIPKDLPLLSMEENNNTKFGIPFSWYVRCYTLYYFDADGKEHEIDGGEESPDNKLPDIDNDEDDGEEYEEEEDKENCSCGIDNMICLQHWCKDCNHNQDDCECVCSSDSEEESSDSDDSE